MVAGVRNGGVSNGLIAARAVLERTESPRFEPVTFAHCVIKSHNRKQLSPVGLITRDKKKPLYREVKRLLERLVAGTGFEPVTFGL